MSEILDVSPAELTADILNRLSLPGLAPAGAIVGPTNDAQNQAGVISCMPAGLPVIELYVPVQWMRAQLRCLAGTLDEAEVIAQRTYRQLNGKNRMVGYMASTSQRYLIHAVKVAAGPSAHFDSGETWETLIFCELLIATEAL